MKKDVQLKVCIMIIEGNNGTQVRKNKKLTVSAPGKTNEVVVKRN